MSNSSNTGRVLRVGIFFDGTANNQFNSQLGQERQAQGLWLDPDSSYGGEPSNIAKLHQLYPQQAAFNAHDPAVTSLYMGGIGTRTGQADNRFPGQTYGRGRTGVLSKAQSAQTQLAACLKSLVQTIPYRSLRRLQLDVFGFSRGAAAARHFVNLIADTPFKTLFELAPDFECSLEFIGLFDTVAAMGGLDDLGDISDSVNSGLNLYLAPGCAKQVVQLSARDEQRRNFSLNRIAPQWSMDVAVPGAHADVGGGYPLEVQEQVFLTRWLTNRVAASTPIKQTLAWQTTAAQLEAWQAKDLLDPQDPSARLQIRTDSHHEGNRQDPTKRVQAAVFMQRRIYGHLSRVYLGVMHRLACEHGVPLGQLSFEEQSLPDDLAPITAKLQTQVREGCISLTDEEEAVLRQRYIHQSANWNAAIGKGTGMLDKAFFNIPQEGGRAVFDQQAPVFA